jgi:hypothetical protein
MLNRQAMEITEILNKPRGSQITYHVGFLAIDREENENKATWREYDETAKIAYNLYEARKVTLVQKRLSPMIYEYIAVRL